jgi:hypothetical protein
MGRKMTDRKQYVIYNHEETWQYSLDCEPLFWSNEDGWGSLSTATVFDPKEIDYLDLPMGGKWLTYAYAENLVKGWELEMEDPDNVPDLIKDMPCWGKETSNVQS